MEINRVYLHKRISPEEPYEDLLKFPRYFEIETVNACNAKCPFCTISDWDRRDGRMKDELFDKIADEISKHPEVKRIHLYRDGEPLLDKKLSKRIKKLKDAGIRRVGISTNVELLDGLRAISLLESGIDEVILSIDSLEKETYEQLRVGLDFNRVLKNALGFIKLRDDLRPECQIWVRMIRQPLNETEWMRYKRYWTGLLKSSDRVDFRRVHNWGSQLPGHHTARPETLPCVALWSLMVIFADGSVPLCNVDYNNKHPLGNVNDSSIEELWTSTLQNHRRFLHENGRRGEIKPCKNCNVWT